MGSMGSPTLQSSLTKHVPPEYVGQMLGAVGLLHALARVVAPTVFNLIYSITVGKFTQAVFVCLGSGFALAFGLSWFIKPHGMLIYCLGDITKLHSDGSHIRTVYLGMRPAHLPVGTTNATADTLNEEEVRD
jgi:hypothetical protein